MAVPHGKGTKVLLDYRDVSAWFNSSDLGNTMDLAETTTYGASVKTYIAGLKDADFTLAGLFDAELFAGDTASFDSLLSSLFGTSSLLVTVGLNGLVEGGRSVSAQVVETEYSIHSPVSDAVSVDVALKPSAQEPGKTAVVLHTLQIETATVDGATQDQGAASADGGVGFLHVTANTRNGASVFKVQHSTNGSAWVDLISFASVGSTTRAAERVAVAGTVNRYVRGQLFSLGGSSGGPTYTITFVRG